MTWVCNCGKLNRLAQERLAAGAIHETRQMFVLRDRAGDAIGYFPRKEDAEQRMLVDEFVDDAKMWVTVR